MRFGINGHVAGVDEVGRTTIDVLSLNRGDLVDARAQKLEHCLRVLVGVRGERDVELFRKELLDDSPYCGVARIAFFYMLSAFAGMFDIPKPSFRTIVEDSLRIVLTASEDQLQTLQELARSHPQPEEFPILREIVTEQFREDSFSPRLRASQVERIRIRNFKGIAQLDLEIPSLQDERGVPCMMLLGENSTGKSTALQAIALALMGQKMRLRIGVSPEDRMPRDVAGWQLEDTVTPEVILEFDTGEPIKFQIDPLTRRFVGEEHPSIVLFSFGSRRFFGKEVIRRQTTSPVRSLFDPFAKLQHPGRWIQTLAPEAFNALARAMREVLILREDDKIERDAAGRLFVRANGRDTPLEGLSDGYRSLMAMVLDIMRGMIDNWGDLENARGLVLIDEIETHLHPRWKLRVMSALRRAMPNVQFIATTHDPLCLRGMHDGEVQVFVRDEDQQVALLKGLPDVRGLRAEQLLTSDYFGLASTADPEVEDALERLVIPFASNNLQRNRDHGTLRSFQWLGDTPFEQIVNEAFKRFIDEDIAARQVDRRQVREEAVNDLLVRLRALRMERPS
ncbi:AAA family ATPase [Duganella sp. LX20W]|uniref:AAA family ATPase n=1 Tax=Rugamonas brunnea TaxID=2758569 RepID=A0A7W2IE99_9BURK|nr:AAA family ATPase [Rugamonas brunnea]